MLALERRLGRELFHRMARGYTLTPEGQQLLTQAVGVEHRMQPITRVSPEQARPLVKVSAGVWVTHVLCEKLPELTLSGEIRLRFITADELVDIARCAAVIGIRNRRPEGPGLAGHARAVLPTFIGARFGALKQVSPEIAELAHDQWLVTHHEDRFVPAVRKVIDRLYLILKHS